MHSSTQMPASKRRQSVLSSTSLLSTTSRASYTSSSSSSSSPTSPSHPSTTAWVPYASLRAIGTVHNKIIERQRQHALNTQQQQVAQLPTTPRRQHIHKPATPPLLPPLETAEEKRCEDEVVSDRRPEEEQKEALTIDSHRSNGSKSSRPSTATKSTRSRTTSQTAKQQPPQQPQPQPQDIPQQPSDQPTQPPQTPPQPTSPPLDDPLPAYLSANKPSQRLARLAQKRAAAHQAVLDEFHAWQSAHKAEQRQLFHTLSTQFLTSHHALLPATPPPPPATTRTAIASLIQGMQTAMEQAVEDGLGAVEGEVGRCVERLIDVGWRREGEVWAELRGVVEAWNVWTVRNRRSVAELVYLVRKEELERQEKEDERLAKEAAEREKELAATQLAATVASDATTAAAVPATASAMG